MNERSNTETASGLRLAQADCRAKKNIQRAGLIGRCDAFMTVKMRRNRWGYKHVPQMLLINGGNDSVMEIKLPCNYTWHHALIKRGCL